MHIPTLTVTHPAVVRDAFGLARIGTTANDIRGIRYRQANPADNDPGTPPAPAAPTPPAPGSTLPGAPAPTPPAPTPPAAPADTAPALRFEDLDDRTQKYVKGLRTEAENHRLAKEAALADAAAAKTRADAILRAAGFNPDGTPYTDVTPEALQAKLQNTTTDAETTKRENLVLRVGPALGADVDKLLDSRSFTSRLEGLKADDREGITSLITEAIEKDPTLKTGPAPAAASGGATHTGTTPTGTRQSKSAALQARYATPASR